MTIGRPGIDATTAFPTVSPVTAALFPAIPLRTVSSTPRIVAAPPKSDTEPTTARARAEVPQPLPLRATDDAVKTDPSAGYATRLSAAFGRCGTTATLPSISGWRPGCSSAKPATRRQRGGARDVAVSSFPAGLGFGGGAVVIAAVVVATVVVAAVVVGVVDVTVVLTSVVVVAVVSVVVVVVVAASGGPAWMPPAASPAANSDSTTTTTPTRRRIRRIIAEMCKDGASRPAGQRPVSSRRNAPTVRGSTPCFRSKRFASELSASARTSSSRVAPSRHAAPSTALSTTSCVRPPTPPECGSSRDWHGLPSAYVFGAA